MRFSLRSCAVLSVVITSLLTVFAGCMTPEPVREVDPRSSESHAASSVETPSGNGKDEVLEEGETATTLPENASVFLSKGLSSGFDPVIVENAVAAGWFYPLEGGGTDKEDHAESDRITPGAMGLYASSQSLYLAYRPAPSASGGQDGSTQISLLLPQSENRRVRTFEPVDLTTRPGRPTGFRVRFSGDNRDEEIIVIWTNRLESAPYTGRLPMTAVRRTAFRDLTDDGVREMVHLSVVFDTGGKREIIVDALRWDSTDFVHIGSISLIRAINEELTHLEERLRNDDDAQWVATANAALQPLDEAPPVGPFLPAERVRVPRIAELSIDLGRGEWQFFHNIAVEGNLYRLRIHLEANPLAEHPARIAGIQGL
ncbi:MAG: hypothetical protein WD492_15265 [Alkalispirochaeta sp.]